MISQGRFEDAGSDLVKVRVDGASGTMLLDQSERKNVISRRMIAQLSQALSDLHQEKRVRAVILTGSGDTFSAGSDLFEVKEDLDDPQAQERWFADSLAQKDLIESMLRFPKPIIAAINGPALGLGAALVLASDLVVATGSGEFGFPETQRGLVPGVGAPLLAFRIGAAAAADLLMRAENVSAEECRRLGIYRWIVDHDLVWAKADALARELEKTSAAAVAMTKRLLNETVGEQLFTQLAAGAAATASARTTEGAVEGIKAFFEKRDPDWP